MKSHLRLNISCLLIATVLLSAGCSSKTESPTAKPEVVVILGQGSFNLNPYSPVLANRRVGHLIFSGLTRINADSDPEPDLLAELPTKSNGGISNDGRRVTYRLREDVRWHDGAPVTAEDVRFTLEALRQSALLDDPAVDYGNITRITVESSTTLSLELGRPDAPAAWRFAPFVLPASRFVDEADVYSSAFWTSPIGSGTHRCQSALPGEWVRLVPVSGEGPRLKIVFASNAKEQLAGYDGPSAAVWVDGPPAASGAESLVETPSAVWSVWLMNTSADKETSDVGLRRVLAALTPPDPTVATPTVGPWGITLPRRMTLRDKDVASAMRASGWRRSGPTYRKGDVKIDLKIGSTTLLAETDLYVTGYRDKLNELGLKGTTSVEPGWGQGGPLDLDSSGTGKYDFARTSLLIGAPYTIGWSFDSDDIPSLKNPYGLNVTRLRDDRLDAAADAVRAAGEPDEARRRMNELGGLLLKTNAVIFDGQVPARALVKGVRGVSAHPLPEYALSSAPAWSFEQPQR